jgi:hypothetical protein
LPDSDLFCVVRFSGGLIPGKKYPGAVCGCPGVDPVLDEKTRYLLVSNFHLRLQQRFPALGAHALDPDFFFEVTLTKWFEWHQPNRGLANDTVTWAKMPHRITDHILWDQGPVTFMAYTFLVLSTARLGHRTGKVTTNLDQLRARLRQRRDRVRHALDQLQTIGLIQIQIVTTDFYPKSGSRSDLIRSDLIGSDSIRLDQTLGSANNTVPIDTDVKPLGMGDFLNGFRERGESLARKRDQEAKQCET